MQRSRLVHALNRIGSLRGTNCFFKGNKVFHGVKQKVPIRFKGWQLYVFELNLWLATNP